MTAPRNPSLTAWIVATFIGVPLLYVASFGPACRTVPGAGQMTIYRPCAYLATHGPPPMRQALRWWIELCGGKVALFYMDFEFLLPYLDSPPKHGTKPVPTFLPQAPPR